MNKFTLSPHGEQHRLQHADANGNGTHIICAAEELAQLRELLAPMAWQDRPSGEGTYAWRGSNGRDDLFDVSHTTNGDMIAVGFSHAVSDFDEFGGLWLKLPNVPETEGR